MFHLPSSLSDAIVAEAREWVGTPYHHMADVKQIGVDCGMLLVRIFCDLKICPPIDPRPYTRDWHLHRSEEVYLGNIQSACDEISLEELAPGDVIMFRVGRCYSHGAVVTVASPLRVVHAMVDPGCVVEEEIRTNPMVQKYMSTARFFRARQR